MRKSICFIIAMAAVADCYQTMTRKQPTRFGASTRLSMVADLASVQHFLTEAPHWAQFASQGIADAAVTATDATKEAIVCPAFGQPGWAPFCFLQGNFVFEAFDAFQLFIQQSIVSLHDGLASLGMKNAYGPSIILFTCFVRLAVFPLSYKQIASSQMTQALQPKIKEIREMYPDDKTLQNQMTALLYQETDVNPLAGCLPSIVQIPVFLSLYRSFLNLAQAKQLDESFLWIPNLQGPTFGERSSDWILKLSTWHDMTPTLGWPDTLAYLSLPVLLIIAQTLSLKILSPPSDDPTIQKSQQILKYLPWMLGYFALSVPSGLGIYWVVNNFLSTATTAGVKEYLKQNPPKKFDNIDLEKLANSQNSVYMNPVWGYKSKSQMIEEAQLNYKPELSSRIPADFSGADIPAGSLMTPLSVELTNKLNVA